MTTKLPRKLSDKIIKLNDVIDIVTEKAFVGSFRKKVMKKFLILLLRKLWVLM